MSDNTTGRDAAKSTPRSNRRNAPRSAPRRSEAPKFFADFERDEARPAVVFTGAGGGSLHTDLHAEFIKAAYVEQGVLVFVVGPGNTTGKLPTEWEADRCFLRAQPDGRAMADGRKPTERCWIQLRLVSDGKKTILAVHAWPQIDLLSFFAGRFYLACKDLGLEGWRGREFSFPDGNISHQLRLELGEPLSVEQLKAVSRKLRECMRFIRPKPAKSARCRRLSMDHPPPKPAGKPEPLEDLPLGIPKAEDLVHGARFAKRGLRCEVQVDPGLGDFAVHLDRGIDAVLIKVEGDQPFFEVGLSPRLEGHGSLAEELNLRDPKGEWVVQVTEGIPFVTPSKGRSDLSFKDFVQTVVAEGRLNRRQRPEKRQSDSSHWQDSTDGLQPWQQVLANLKLAPSGEQKGSEKPVQRGKPTAAAPKTAPTPAIEPSTPALPVSAGIEDRSKVGDPAPEI